YRYTIALRCLRPLRLPRPPEQSQPRDAAIRKNIQPRVSDGVDRPQLVFEQVPRVRLQRRLRQQLDPVLLVVRHVDAARAGRVALEVPRVDDDAADRPGGAEPHDRPGVTRPSPPPPAASPTRRPGASPRGA